MGRVPRDTQQASPSGQGADLHELMRLKMELAAAQGRGERGALTRLLSAHPSLAGELTQFVAGLVATSSYEQEAPTADTMALAERARTRAFAVVFPTPAPLVAPAGSELAGRAIATLKALRRARGLSLALVARQLSVGPDVLSDLEAGLIRAPSVPERLTRALSDVLLTSADRIRALLNAQPVVRPALQRNRSSAEEVSAHDFAEAIHRSPSMTAEQKASWLGE
ncbi:MAG TPA: helix-turn-helix transcriptional regulator [Ktedonobacterales bacterium]|jgi:transcriptional regulator with XRE-family HTH domain|nr:helix-turn-helix transcriptional regulator [Ktedonobacterales bacterium]